MRVIVKLFLLSKNGWFLNSQTVLQSTADLGYNSSLEICNICIKTAQISSEFVVELRLILVQF